MSFIPHPKESITKISAEIFKEQQQQIPKHLVEIRSYMGPISSFNHKPFPLQSQNSQVGVQ
jgi:hypothetical protein